MKRFAYIPQLLAFSLGLCSVAFGQQRASLLTKEDALAELRRSCATFNLIVYGLVEHQGENTSFRCIEVWMHENGKPAVGDTFEFSHSSPEGRTEGYHAVVFLSDLPPGSYSWNVWKITAGHLTRCPELSVADVRSAVAAHRRTVPIKQIERIPGKTTSSPEFVTLIADLGLLLKRYRKEEVFGPRGVGQLRITEQFEGSGLVVCTESTRRMIDGDASQEQVVTKIQLVLRSSGVVGTHFSPRWKGELPVPEVPNDPASLRKRFGMPESDMLDTKESLLGGTPQPFGKTRWVDYHFSFRSVDRFPFCFVFEDDVFTVLEIYPATNDVRVVRPQPPAASPKQGSSPQ